MISVEQALDKLLSFVEVLDPEEKPILDCLDQVLAQDVYADIDIPPWDNSAMDGYAVRAESTQGASMSSPKILKVIGEVAAGYISRWEVKPGAAVRIMTGAPLPRGADAVVQFENTDEVERRASRSDSSKIGILCPAEKGLNVRYKGEDIAKGTLVLEKRTGIRPQGLGNS